MDAAHAAVKKFAIYFYAYYCLLVQQLVDTFSISKSLLIVMSQDLKFLTHNGSEIYITHSNGGRNLVGIQTLIIHSI